MWPVCFPREGNILSRCFADQIGVEKKEMQTPICSMSSMRMWDQYAWPLWPLCLTKTKTNIKQSNVWLDIDLEKLWTNWERWHLGIMKLNLDMFFLFCVYFWYQQMVIYAKLGSWFGILEVPLRNNPFHFRGSHVYPNHYLRCCLLGVFPVDSLYLPTCVCYKYPRHPNEPPKHLVGGF